MNHDDIIRMAREAGVYSGANEMVFAASLERFAALVLANNPPQSFMSWQEGFEAGAAKEREACAKVCQDRVQDAPDAHAAEAILCAAAIRARGRLQEDQKPG